MIRKLLSALQWKKYILFSIAACFMNCATSTETDISFVRCDSSFAAGNYTFPDDSIYRRSLTGTGNNRRMHAFIDKCISCDSIKIGFIGGSITAGAEATSKNLRFSSLFCSSIKGSFPNLENVMEINAGIGGTDSRFACSRVISDMFSFDPDLIVIEFAVNDFGIGDTQYIRKVFEGLVRQCLGYKDNVPVMLLFMSKGDGTNIQEIHEDIGNYYSLPMISYRDAIWPIVESDWNYWSIFFATDPHPNDIGHRVCACLLYTYLENAVNSSRDPSVAIPACRYSNLYQNAGFMSSIDTTVTIIQSNWTSNSKENNKTGFTSADSLDSLTLLANCDEIAFCINSRPADTSAIRVIVDNGVIDTVLNNYFEEDHQTTSSLYISSSIKAHVVRIRHLGSKSFDIYYILYAKHPGQC